MCMKQSNKYLTYGIFLCLGLLYSLGNIDRVLNSDEVILAEHAYWLNQEGFVKSRLFVDMGQGWEVC